MSGPAVNATMTKFGYPATGVAETPLWSVQVRPQQATLGALVLVCREPVTAFGALSAPAYAELGRHVAAAEGVLKRLFAYDRINYLMLMMVDPDVHFHVLPRYAAERTFEGIAFRDPGWPKPPDLAHAPALPDGLLARLTAAVAAAWPGARA